MANKLSSHIETFLQSPKGYKKSWIRSLLVMTAAVIIFIATLVISYQYGPLSGIGVSTNDGDKVVLVGLAKTLAQTGNAPFINAATWISIAGFCILGVPFLYLFAVWMSGINQITKAKHFHFLLWITAFIILLLAVIAMILLIRASIFDIQEVIPPAQEETAGFPSIKNRLVFF